ncbi:putative phosphothreonine lyase domain-containing protein [Streptomyces sp. NPDC098085]|uniref:putative phosphothreonine lyase domain-containing protein n=1 Tax=Streptomyces sp. NPDC098085 TaxID=3366094 RepID=UPI003822F981
MTNVTYRYFMHDEPTQTGQQPTKAPPPAADTRRRWQGAMAPGVDFSAPAAVNEFAKAGKWLWFLPLRALDAGWRLIKTAVEAGQLGPGAKVATLGSDFDGDPTRRPVIIYTANHHDEQDVQRVLNALRALGVRDALAYKTDETTARGEYGDGTSIYTSPAGTTKIIRRDRQTRPAAQRPRAPHIRPTAGTG